MSQYTTGELAKLNNISVRTVQFYDSKGLLKPSELTEGGRRLYYDEDLKKLNLICLLKALGLSLDSIKGILDSENSSKITLLLLKEHEAHVIKEINMKQKQLDAIAIVKNNIKNTEKITVNLISDIENIMSGNKKLTNTYVKLGLMGLTMTAIQAVTIIHWISKGNWIPFAIGMIVIIPIGILLFNTYYNNTKFICPSCNNKFKPSKKEFLFAGHTPKTRKLTCLKCGKTDYCVESYAD